MSHETTILGMKHSSSSVVRPAVAGTWDFSSIALGPAIEALLSGQTSVDAVEQGIRAVELDTKEQYFVGVGGLPNSAGKMELDAAVMDHDSRYGAVMALQNIATPISVARSVMDECVHNVLVGEGALQWAVSRGFKPGNVLTEDSKKEWEAWKRGQDVSESSHDTVGLICLDSEGRLAAGTSTSGWKFKHPGRIGDSPLVGSGIYCNHNAAAVATGAGEEIMRACLSFLVVELISQGFSVQEACALGIRRVTSLPSSKKPGNNGSEALIIGVVAMDRLGNVGAASTVTEENPHRGRPAFPCMCWRAGEDPTNSQHMLLASLQGVNY